MYDLIPCEGCPSSCQGPSNFLRPFQGSLGCALGGATWLRWASLGQPALVVALKLRWQLCGWSNSSQDSNEEEAIGNAGLQAKALTLTPDSHVHRSLNLGQDTLTKYARTDDTTIQDTLAKDCRH
jgi:hypothetical protein